MRKLKIIEHISLDGVIQHSADGDNFAYSDWTAPYRTPAGRDAVLEMYGEEVAPGGGAPAGQASFPALEEREINDQATVAACSPEVLESGERWVCVTYGACTSGTPVAQQQRRSTGESC